MKLDYNTKEIWCDNCGRKIYGVAFIPQIEETVPLVIFAHELGNNHESGIPYAKRLASMGVAAYVFDFCGGSIDRVTNKSDGKTTEMSVLTEVADLEAVMERAAGWEFVNPDKIMLLGGSQGGMVSMVTALKNPEKVSALMLMYPALCIWNDVHETFASKEEVPEVYGMWGHWIMVGRGYAEAIWNYDIYESLNQYKRPVLLLHGDQDHMVDLSYSRRAAEILPDCEFHVIPGGGHIFSGRAFVDAMRYVREFVEKNICDGK